MIWKIPEEQINNFFNPFLQDEWVLEPDLCERVKKLFRVLLRYLTDFLVWEENFELSAELQPGYGGARFDDSTLIWQIFGLA